MWFLNLRSESGPSASVNTLDRAHLLNISVPDGRVIPSTGDGMKPIALDAIRPVLTNKRVVFLTHGYNVTLRNGLNALAGVRQFLSLDDSYVVIGVLWPGDSTTMLNYIWEHQDAITAGKVLAAFVDTYCADALEVNFISHSLGGRLGLECLKTVNRRFREVCLTAPAVNADAFAKRYKGVEDRADRIAVLASKADKILMLAYPPGNFTAYFNGNIDSVMAPALGRSGAKPRPANVTNYQIPSTVLWLNKDVDKNFDHMDYYPGQTMRIPPHIQTPDASDKNNARPAQAARTSLVQLMTHILPLWPV